MVMPFKENQLSVIVSAMAPMICEGMLVYEQITGSGNAEKFIRGHLVPNML